MQYLNEFKFHEETTDETTREIYLIEKIYNKFWNKDEKENTN